MPAITICQGQFSLKTKPNQTLIIWPYQIVLDKIVLLQTMFLLSPKWASYLFGKNCNCNNFINTIIASQINFRLCRAYICFSVVFFLHFSCDLDNFPKILNSMRAVTLWYSGHPTEDLMQVCVCVCVCVCVYTLSHIRLLRPHGREPTRLLCPWNFLGMNTGMGCHFLFHMIFPTQGSSLHVLHLLHWQVDSLPLWHPESHLTHRRP